MTRRIEALLLASVALLVACSGERPKAAEAPTESAVETPAKEDAPAETEEAAEKMDTTNWEGTYGRKHMIEGEEAMDCMTLTSKDGALEFAFTLEFHNGHTCEMQGAAKHVEGNRWRHETGACSLDFTLGDDVVLRDPSGGCRQEFCGARGSIDEAAFSTKALSPDSAPCAP